MLVFKQLISQILSLKASGKLKKATKLISKGDVEGAYNSAQEGLEIMDSPKIRRKNPSELVILLHLTYMVDGLAKKLDNEFPIDLDYRDSYQFLKTMEGKPVYTQFEKWMKRIEEMGILPEPENNDSEIDSE